MYYIYKCIMCVHKSKRHNLCFHCLGRFVENLLPFKTNLMVEIWNKKKRYQKQAHERPLHNLCLTFFWVYTCVCLSVCMCEAHCTYNVLYNECHPFCLANGKTKAICMQCIYYSHSMWHSQPISKLCIHYTIEHILIFPSGT